MADVLTGLDTGIKLRRGEDCWYVRIVLNGKTIEWVENPDDGWRSYADGPDPTSESVANTFPPIEVVRDDVTTDKFEGTTLTIPGASEPFLTVGTDTRCNWYPMFVCEFSAERMNGEGL